MAPAKRQSSDEEKLEAKRAKVEIEATSSDRESKQQLVVLNAADCDLDFNIEDNGHKGFALHENGFAYCWSGARANVGITGGKYCFGCKIVAAQSVEMDDIPPDQQHVCRLGFSRGDDSAGNLGETDHSFGFGGTGKFSNGGKFLDYGEKFGIGDVIICAIDLENKPLATVGFSKNGRWLGAAKSFDAGPKGLRVAENPTIKLPWASAIFPHVLLKNVVVQMLFCVGDGLVPESGYRPWVCALEDGKAILGPAFSSTKECEVMMMIGLPASGKTTWAEKWAKDHPEKRYVLLGTNLALDQMKVPGLLRKHNYGERFDRLMDRATGIFNTVLSRAVRTGRNYIIDQTNVYKSARKRKMKSFCSFKKVAVVIFPTPQELKIRSQKRFKEMGKEVPADAVNEMLANYVLPTSKDMPGSDENFDQIIFPELDRDETQKHLNEMKSALRTPKRDFSPYSRDSSVRSHGSVCSHGSVSVHNQWSSPYRRDTSVGSLSDFSSHSREKPNHAYSTQLLPVDKYGQTRHNSVSSCHHVSEPYARSGHVAADVYQNRDYGATYPGNVSNPLWTRNTEDSRSYAFEGDRSYISPMSKPPYAYGSFGDQMGRQEFSPGFHELPQHSRDSYSPYPGYRNPRPSPYGNSLPGGSSQFGQYHP